MTALGPAAGRDLAPAGCAGEGWGISVIIPLDRPVRMRSKKLLTGPREDMGVLDRVSSGGK